jgi:DNA-binding NarL/FixJ family response regulator
VAEEAPTRSLPIDLVGRERETSIVERFVDEVEAGPRSLLITGEAGIGKTSVLRVGVARCEASGYRVLRSRSAEEEMPIALVGIVDLFDRVQLDMAPFRSGSEPAEQGRAVLDAFRALSEADPIVVVLDDLQWLDSASARALRFALRRLADERVGFLLAIRSDADPIDPLDVGRTMPPGRSDAIELGALDRDALRRLVGHMVPRISRPTLDRIHRVSGGNPLYALELAGSLTHGAGTPTDAALELPSTLRGAIDSRLDQAPHEIEPLLNAVAAAGRLPIASLPTLLGDVEPDDALQTGCAEGLLVIEENLDVHLSHPLLSSAVYGRMTPLARRDLHAALAAHATDPDVKARHLALSTGEADEAVAQVLEDAAVRADERHSFDVAAGFWSHSLRLTRHEDPESRLRRAWREIEDRAAAGEAGRALALADDLIASTPRGPARAETIVLRSFLEDDDNVIAERLLLEALEDAGDDRLLRGKVLERLSRIREELPDGPAHAIPYLEEAVELADEVGDVTLQMNVRCRLAHVSTMAGTPRPDVMEEAIALEHSISGGAIRAAGPRGFLVKHRFWAGDLEGARALLDELVADPTSAGGEVRRMQSLYDRALIEIAAGEFELARRAVREGAEAAQDTEDSHAISLFRYAGGLIDVWCGDAASVERFAAESLSDDVRRGPRFVARTKGMLGLLALSRSEIRAAATELTEAAELLNASGVVHPGVESVLPDAIEAAALSGDLVRARELLVRLRSQAGGIESVWIGAIAARAEGTVLLAEGKAEQAAETLEPSVRALDESGHRPGAARAALVRGRALVRSGRRAAAGDVLGDARERFSSIGARYWVERATEELARVAPGRADAELTPTERRVAAAVTEGLKNREIAGTLFVSVATVEAHLTHIYRKLGIRSRAELVRLVSEELVDVGGPDRVEIDATEP